MFTAQPVQYAEQALLGALLLNPRLLPGLPPLTADHFDNHTHGILFTVMGRLAVPPPAEHATTPVWVTAVADAARADAPGVTQSYLHTLIAACPAHAHAAAYAGMIRADHARRTLRERALTLEQAATDTHHPQPATATLAAADALAAELDAFAAAHAPHPGSLPHAPTPAPPPRMPSEDVRADERDLLAALAAAPDTLQRLRWLSADDYAIPLHGAVHRCLNALAHRREPVDPVTVLWEAAHRGLLDHTPAADVMALVSTPTGTPEYWATVVVERALLHQAHTTARHIHAYADAPANTPHQLITGSRRALAALHAIRVRWHQAAAAPRAPGTRRPAAARGRPPPSTRLPVPAATAPRRSS
ncbi:DnaB-like helicase N-terminal domain-containing protein [Streptomyces ramulosus]